MNHTPCSVAILTYNSGKTLRRALASVSFADDIVLNDGGSTDDTLAIAKEFGCRVIEQDAAFKNAQGRLVNFSGARNQALDAIRNDWLLYIDSDESISDGLRDDIIRIVTKPHAEGDPLVYRVPMRIVLDGREIKHASNYPGYQHRFFNRRSGARYIKPVHERIAFDTAHVHVGTLTHPWYVYATMDDARHYLRNTAGYRALEVQLFEHMSWGVFFNVVLMRNMRTSLGAFVKSIYNYVRYGFKESAPVSEEIGRMLAPWYSIGNILRAMLTHQSKQP